MSNLSFNDYVPKSLAWFAFWLLLIGSPSTLLALEVGFEGLLAFELSDNVEGANSPDEEDGETINGLIGVYGEQRSRFVQAGFSGELDTRRNFADDDSDFETITRFLGAAEFALTPRSWRWYVGDILGGVRADNAVQTIDDTETIRRNVFVTGPSFEYIIDGVSRTNARLLYVNQTEDDDEIESLYTASFSYQRDTTPGSYYGARLNNIYTDLPESDGDQEDGDFNRLSISGFANRVLGFNQLYGELGFTRYETDDESLDGVSAELDFTRRLGPRTSIGLNLSRTLNDQTLSTVQSLIDSGGDTIGLRPEVDGFFTDTSLVADYSVQSNLASINVGVGVSQLDYQLVTADPALNLSADGEDQMQTFAFLAYSRRLTTRLRSRIDVRYEQQEYDNRDDETDSILATATVIYQYNRSIQLEGTFVHDSAEGTVTRFNNAGGVPEAIDSTENRVTIGLRWAPPSRASRDITVQLKSLLQ